MPLWVGATLVAALMQTWRTAMQQKLRGLLSVNAAGFVRYVYALPTGVLLLLLRVASSGQAVPSPGPRFVLACAAGGLMQVVGTTLLIMAFGYRGFVVGTAYAKTEALQAALLGLLLLGQALSPWSWLGILVSLAGVMVLSLGGRNLGAREMLAASVQPAALCGFGTGLCFAITGSMIRIATDTLPGSDKVLQALLALVTTNALQTLMQGGWLALREPDQLRAAFATWRSSAWVGTLSAIGSACWFTGFATAPIALVRSLGQVEVVFTLLFSRFYLKETMRAADVAGLVLVVAGVVVILAGA